MRSSPGRLDPSEEEINTAVNLVEVLEKEEIMWRQRSRIQWLAEGDKNTRFFHMWASQQRKKNRITEITSINVPRLPGQPAIQKGHINLVRPVP
jgi:hypothetical protein